MKTNEKQKKWIIGILVILILAIAGGCIWYFSYKKPHDQAVAAFNTAVTEFNTFIPEYNTLISEYNNVVSNISSKNQELDDIISNAQKLIEKSETPYDESTLTNLKAALDDAEKSKVEVPDLLEELKAGTNDIASKTADIKAETEDRNTSLKQLKSEIKTIENDISSLSTPLDYTSNISNIQEKQKLYENSVLMSKQITNPSESFIIERLKEIATILDIQAVTEENDPNGHLNKQGGYTAAVYFAHSLVNSTDVVGTDTIDKGTDAGGCIEVYSSIQDAEKRNIYLASYDGTILDSGSHNLLGTMVIRTSSKLTATQQKELEKEITDSFLKL